MTPSQFADRIKVQRPTLHHILSGRNNPSLDVVLKIHEAFPQVNLDWLMTGTGDGPVSVPSSFNESEKATGNADSTLFPDIFVGGAKGSINPVFQPEGRKARKYSNPRGGEEPVEKAENSATTPSKPEITEVVVFYSDGSFQKLSHS